MEKFGKIWKNMEKRPFSWAAMAGLGKYCMGGYGQIGVYRVKLPFLLYSNQRPSAGFSLEEKD